MSLTVLTLGHGLSIHETAWIDLYKKRISAFTTLDHIHKKDKFDLYQNLDHPKYIHWIENLIAKKTYLIALDIKGKMLSTIALSRKFSDIQMQSKNITFFIGGSYGIPQTILQKADFKLSLGPITLPHKIAMLVLFEQLYRIHTIDKNIPYHHE